MVADSGWELGQGPVDLYVLVGFEPSDFEIFSGWLWDAASLPVSRPNGDRSWAGLDRLSNRPVPLGYVFKIREVGVDLANGSVDAYGVCEFDHQSLLACRACPCMAITTSA